MVSDRERRALLKVQRSFVAEDPDFARSLRRRPREHGCGTEVGTTWPG